jgi:hypothetical protein
MSMRASRGKLADMADALLHHRPDLDSRRELDARENDGIHVRLLWHAVANAITVAVTDSKTGDHFEVPVEGKHALRAFHHPFAYAA